MLASELAVANWLTIGNLLGLTHLTASQRGCEKISQQLNIVGKRSGIGFVANRRTLAISLSRCLADRVTLMNFTLGRKGLLNFVKAQTGSNMVKIVPASRNGGASDKQTEQLKVVCGANVSYLVSNAWITDKTPMTNADVIVQPNSKVTPNISNIELAEAIDRVLPFVSTEDTRIVLQNVLFTASEGKLVLVSADGVCLAVQQIDYDGEGTALIHADDLKGVANALRKARRVNLSFNSPNENETAIVIETEAIRYKFIANMGSYPNWRELIPSELNAQAHFDSTEGFKALAMFKAIAENPKSFALDLNITEGGLMVSSPDENGSTIISADCEGEGEIRVDGKLLATALKACRDSVDFAVTNAYSPMLFSTDGYKVVIMPMASPQANAQQAEAKKQAEATAEAKKQAEATAEAEAPATAEAEAKPKRKAKAIA